MMGIARVMFGYRIKAGFVNEGREEPMSYEIDWCCGTQLSTLSLVYSFIKNRIDKNFRLDTLPSHSEIKPLQNDEKFMEILLHQIVVDSVEEAIVITEDDLKEADKLSEAIWKS